MDDRGQAVVLGAVLLFGIVTIAFAGYQAYQVPNQNAQTEFQHFEEAKDQMVQLRSAASDTAAVSQPRSVTFPLGTSFQQRSFAVNPPPPTGELATGEAHTITIYNSAGTVTDTVEARLLTYDPNYREYQPGVLRYEHGIVYLDARDVGGGVVFLEEYMAPLRLVPIQNEFGASGQRQIGLELYRPGGTEPIEISSDDTVSIPTNLPNPNKPNTTEWDAALEVSVDNESYSESDSSENLSTFNLSGDEIEDIAPVGIQDRPDNTNSSVDYDSTTDSPPPNGPMFESFTVTASDTSGSSGNVKAATVNGTVENPDQNGQIQMTLSSSSNSNQNSIQMSGDFEFTTDASNAGTPDVEIRLLDGDDNVIQECESEGSLTSDNTLTKSDFTCR